MRFLTIGDLNILKAIFGEKADNDTYKPEYNVVNGAEKTNGHNNNPKIIKGDFTKSLTKKTK